MDKMEIQSEQHWKILGISKITGTSLLLRGFVKSKISISLVQDHFNSLNRCQLCRLNLSIRRLN